jgi:hypothetical protein
MSAANLHLYKIDTLHARLLDFCNSAAGEKYSTQNDKMEATAFNITIIVSYKYVIFSYLITSIFICQIKICIFWVLMRFYSFITELIYKESMYNINRPYPKTGRTNTTFPQPLENFFADHQ